MTEYLSVLNDCGAFERSLWEIYYLDLELTVIHLGVKGEQFPGIFCFITFW